MMKGKSTMKKLSVPRLWIKVKRMLEPYAEGEKVETSLRLEFFPVEGTETCVVSVTLLKNGKKSSILSRDMFSKLMNNIEWCFSELRLKSSEKALSELYFSNISKDLGYEWFERFNCHKLFLIPNNSISDVYFGFLNNSFRNTLKLFGINRVVVGVR